MLKKYYLYADFETTYVPLPDGYENYNEYYESKNAKKPEVYSFNILYDKEYGELIEDNFHTKKINDDEFNYNYGIDGKKFVRMIQSLKKDTTIFFNNLKGFDGHYLIPILDSMDFEQVIPYKLNDFNQLDSEQQNLFAVRMDRIRDDILESPKLSERYYELLYSKSADLNTLTKKQIKKFCDSFDIKYSDRWLKDELISFLTPIVNEDEELRTEINYLLSEVFIGFYIKKRWTLLLPNEYSVIADKNKNIYEIKIGLDSVKRTKGIKQNRAVIIRDNLTLFPTSVKKMGETISSYMEKNHGYSTTQCDLYLKQELSSNYKKQDKYKSIKELESDGNELDYLIQDTFILWKFHKLIEKKFPRKDWKMTIGSTSYADWELMFSKKLIKIFQDKGLIKEVKVSDTFTKYEYNGKLLTWRNLGKELIKTIYPTRWLDSRTSKDDKVWNKLYEWYSGGITMVNEKYRGQLVQSLKFLDINSSYPAQMVKDIQVPCGIGVEGDVKDFPFKYYTLIPKKNIHNEKGLPFLYDSNASTRQYTKKLEKGKEYKFTTLSLKNFKKYYSDNEDEYTLRIDYSFKTQSLKFVFGDYIKKWYKLKQKASKENDDDEILKEIAKLFMNSSYGKHGTKIERESSLWNQEQQQWDTITETKRAKYYLPFAIAIVELGRQALVDGVSEYYDDFVYCDTDSIAVLNPEKFTHIEYSKTKLGGWDIEYENMYGIFRRPKQYMLLNSKDETQLKIAFAGINFNKFMLSDRELKELEENEREYRKLNLMDFVLGKEIDNQTKPYKLLGSGIIITEQIKRIKPVWSYDSTQKKKEDRELYPILKEQIYIEPDDFKQTIKDIQNLARISAERKLND